VCTSSTRPGSPVDGQHIYETDTDKTLSWDGTSWNPVSGAASYQAGEPANPSVGSLWVDSDETASQLNTNDFLLKSDASAASGYVSKVGGDTVIASGAAVKPLVLKGASSQTANLQEWQDSTGAVVASVSPTGRVAGSGLTLVKKQTIGTGVSSVTVTDAFSATYENYVIVVSGGTTSQDGAINLQFTGTTTQYYYAMSYANWGTNTALAITNVNGSNFGYVGFAHTGGLSLVCNLVAPFLAKYTTFSAQVGGGTYGGNNAGVNKTTTSHTGFSLIHDAAGQTFTGGTIYVYGYGTN
jgi:hypothetical protein